jgi:Family of unknown function (DUF6441)
MRYSASMPDVMAELASTEEDMAKAVTLAMDDTGSELQNELRGQIERSGLGARMAKSWRRKTFPERTNSIDATAYLWSRAPIVVDAFDRGVTIRAVNKRWLAVPTKAAGKSRPRMNPKLWEQRNGIELRAIWLPRGPSLLVADNARINKAGLAKRNQGRNRIGVYPRSEGRVSSVIFLLFRQTRLPKLLDIQGAADEAASRFENHLTRRWRLS